MGLKFTGNFKPVAGAMKMGNSYVPAWMTGIAIKPPRIHTAQPGILNLPSDNNTWMNGITTTGIVDTHTVLPGILNLPSVNNTWMNGITLI